MDRLKAMQIFVKVAECGSFSAAARQLHMNAPAITRAVAWLEEQIGTRLLTRTTRSVMLTEAGQRYIEHCQRILVEVEEAEAIAAGSFSTPRGALSVTASVLFGQIYVMPLLLEYLDLYPETSVRTLLVDRVVNLLDEGMDVAVRIGHLPPSSLRVTRVGHVRRIVCGSPAYLERYGIPKLPADLLHHRTVATTGATASPEWRLGRLHPKTITLNPRLHVNTNEAAIQAAVNGWGLIRVLSYQIAPLLADGRLVAVLTDCEEEPLPVQIVHPEGRRVTAKISAFVQLATRRLRSNPALKLD